MQAFGAIASPDRSDIRARTAGSVPSNTPEYRSSASQSAPVRAWAAVTPFPPAVRCRLSRNASTSRASAVNAWPARKFGATARPSPMSADASTSALTIPVTGLTWCSSRSKVRSGEAIRNPPSTVSARRETSASGRGAAAGAPHAGHCGRFTRLWRRQFRSRASRVHTAPSRPDRPRTNQAPAAVAARPAATPARLGRPATADVPTSPAPRRRRAYSSTRRWPRSRCARHRQQPVSPGRKNGPTHASAPPDFASSHGRPLARFSALISARPLRR